MSPTSDADLGNFLIRTTISAAILAGKKHQANGQQEIMLSSKSRSSTFVETSQHSESGAQAEERCQEKTRSKDAPLACQEALIQDARTIDSA
ncbi:hypothetical protein Tco_1387209 [Tanacetum coccineum]